MFNRLSLLLIVSLLSSACGPAFGTPTIDLPVTEGVSLVQQNGAWSFVSPVTVSLPANAAETRFISKITELSATGFLANEFMSERFAVPARIEMPLVHGSLPRNVIRLQLEVAVISWDGNVETTSATKTVVYAFDNR